jgi:hypothetical protein
MLFTVSLTVHFGSSDRLAAADGTAVSTTMVLTTVTSLQSCDAGPDNDRIELRHLPFDCHSNRVHDLKAMPLVKRDIP